ncbi:hypothetical protein AYO20_05981 [Fonsecaea nubica]|uniref:C2H2-type domain-containing protein n=1 Tax=Fonsecaea nubica TaxID=856822 RepID=A0A178CZ79_9EURO|nr:hypothetical protein AYO20_05981 [Fonsecaea nubica]OAL34786.1 hypothetical protein AYO20_05981 [Fonsecaea nubica]
MDMLDAAFVNHDYSSFHPALVPSEVPGDIPSYLDSSCAGVHSDNPEPSLARSHFCIPGQEHYVEDSFGTDSDGLGDFCSPNCEFCCSFPTPWQVCYQSVEDTLLQDATRLEISHTPSTLEPWSPVCTSTSHSSQASPPALWEEIGGHNYSAGVSVHGGQHPNSMQQPGFPVQLDCQLDRKIDPTSPDPQKIKSKSLHREHKREHDGQYSCATCQKTFTGAGNLAIHMKMHGAGPYVCQICTKEFPRASNYRRHLNVHNENRQKRKCPKDGCGKTYAFAGCLSRHIRSHYTDYKCGDCHKVFNRSDLRNSPPIWTAPVVVAVEHMLISPKTPDQALPQSPRATSSRGSLATATSILTVTAVAGVSPGQRAGP